MGRNVGHGLQRRDDEHHAVGRDLAFVGLELVAVHRSAVLDLDPEDEVGVVAQQLGSKSYLQVDEATEEVPTCGRTSTRQSP